MARTKKTEAADEKLEKPKFDLFAALAAIDNKDYAWYSRLTPDQQRLFVPYMMLLWVSAVKAGDDLGDYYLRNTDYTANRYFFDETISAHPELQWLMLCASSPGMGKQFHVYIPHLSVAKTNFRESISLSEAREYFEKVGVSSAEVDQYVEHQNRAVKIAKICESLNFDDISLLATVITDEEIEAYYRDSGI